MNKELLREMVEKKLVFVQKHPTADLFIYNYSAKVQYEKLWNEITLITRGLITDGEMNIVARPFSKFFNLEELKPHEIPALPFHVYEKLDGSLGILYWLNDKPQIATRGSFTSPQAVLATKILHEKYAQSFQHFEKDKTYLFEIIYPENRIVVDYGSTEDLILLAVIDSASGADMPLPEIGFTIVKQYDGIQAIAELKVLQEENKEGYVVRFSNGLRLKIKFEEYKRLHRIVTGVSNVDVWGHLATNKSFNELLERVPDEFYQWLMKTKTELIEQFEKIKHEANLHFKELHQNDRKKFALAVRAKAKDFSPIMFRLFDKRNADDIIWEMVKPKWSKPFKNAD